MVCHQGMLLYMTNTLALSGRLQMKMDCFHRNLRNLRGLRGLRPQECLVEVMEWHRDGFVC